MLRIAQITDLHLRPEGLLFQGAIDTAAATRRAVDAVLSRHGDIDALIVSGDVSDHGEPDAYAQAASLLGAVPVPVLAIPGNHDAPATMAKTLAGWPGLAPPALSGSLCHAHEMGSVTLVCLDTATRDEDGAPVGYGTLGEEQLQWLDERLSHARHAFIAMHHPPFEVGIGFMDAVGLTDREAFAAVLERHSNVSRIVCGHVHRPIFGAVAGVPALAVPGVAHQVGLALGDGPVRIVMEPPAYAIHLIDGDRVVSHIGYVDEAPVHKNAEDD